MVDLQTDWNVEIMELMPSVSEFEVAVEGPFTPARFHNLYKMAVEQMLTDAPSLPTETAKRCLALLIAHYWASKGGDVGVTSERIGDWGATYQLGELTKYFASYKDAIARYSCTTASEGVERADVAMEEMNLDMDVPETYGED